MRNCPACNTEITAKVKDGSGTYKSFCKPACMASFRFRGFHKDYDQGRGEWRHKPAKKNPLNIINAWSGQTRGIR